MIIPNLNSPLIGRTLAALHGQRFDLRAVEVLVVGQDAPGQVREDGLVRLVDTGQPTGAAFNRNLGMHHARGDIFCFTDADCEPDPDWLARLVAMLRTVDSGGRRVDVVGGGVIFQRGNYWSTCDHVSWFNQFLASAPRGERLHLPTLNLAVRRGVVEVAGPIDEAYPVAAGEDTEWTMRMRAHGFALHFEPEATVTHIAQRTSFAALWRHGYNYGRYSPKVGYPAGHAARDDAAASMASDDTAAQNRAMGNGVAAEGRLPRGLRHPWRLRVAAPVLAGLATGRAWARAGSAGGWQTVPGVWLSKLAWCFGAAQALQQDGLRAQALRREE